MVRRAGFAVLGLALVAAVIVFAVWRPFVGWDYADVLSDVQADFGRDRPVLAVEIERGTVAFVMKEGDGRVRVRHYARHCVLHDGDSMVNGSPVEGNCEIRTRRQVTFTRAATGDDAGPFVPLGELRADVVERFEAAGMRSLDDPVLWRGRWRFDAPLAVPKSAAPDGTDIRPARGTSGEAQLAVRAMVGAPPVDNP